MLDGYLDTTACKAAETQGPFYVLAVQADSRADSLQSRKHTDSDEVPEPAAADDDAPKTKAGRNPKKSRWAISNFTAPPTVNQSTKGDPVWRWQCKWCPYVINFGSNSVPESLLKINRAFRTSTRTKGCVKFEQETIELVVDSNFHSHLAKCPQLPPDASFEAYEAAELAAMAGTRPLPSASTSNIVAQRNTMSKFVQEGIANPAVTVTKRGFRERLVKGIALDDLAFSFPERKGMNALLKYLLPRGWKIPGRKTVKADITKLSTLLRERVDAFILVSPCLALRPGC